MRGTFAFLIVLLCSTVAIVSCQGITPTATPVQLSPEATPAEQVSVPSDLPTAAPLWTPTTAPTRPSVQPSQVAATAVAESSLAPGVIASVNGTPLLQADYDRQLAQAEVYLLKQPGLDAKSEAGKQAMDKLREQVLSWMIDQLLIEQAATVKGIVISEAKIDSEIARMKGQDQKRFNDWLSANGLTLDTLRQQVRTDVITAAIRDAVTSSVSRKVMQAHFRHILTSTEQAAQAALAQLKEGQNFIAVARQLSEDETTRQNGGDLGFLPKGVMPPAFEQAGFALKPGEISGVVRSEFGFHIIQLVEIDPEREVSDELWPTVQQRAFEDWLAAQRAQADIRRSAGQR